MRKATLALIALCAFLAVGTAAVLYGVQRTPASDHQDSPLTVSRPGSDLTDVFLFPAADPRKVVLAMDVHPLIPRGMSDGVAFDPAVMYQFKIDTTGSYRENRVIQFRAIGTGDNQRLEMFGPIAPAQAGTVSRWEGTPQTFAFNRMTNLANGVRVFAGPRQDPFYFDLAQFFKIIPDRDYKNHPDVPPPTASCFRNPGVDFLRDYNVLAIVVELPRSMLAGPHGKLGIIHMYTTTSLANANGSYIQVERLARPAVKEAFEMFERHDETNRSSPWADPILGHDIVAFMETKPPMGAGRSRQLAMAVEKVLIPDELTANLGSGSPARYLAVETRGKTGLPTAIVRVVPNAGIEGLKKSIADKSRDFGGRDPSSPVIDLSLGVIFGSLGSKVGLARDDMKETACLTSDHVDARGRGVSANFPYIGRAI